MKREERDVVRVKHIYEAILLIKKFTKELNQNDFYQSEMIQSAVIRQFEIIGEAASNVSNKTQQRFPEVEWRVIKDFRNLLIHEYFRVDASELWYSIENDVPLLKDQMQHLLKEFKK